MGYGSPERIRIMNEERLEERTSGGRVCAAIDLKSFYASVECVERGLDPFKANLVVADPARTEKTICLAVSPALKAHGIPGRARLFEVKQKVEEINRDRLRTGIQSGRIRREKDGKSEFSGSSWDEEELKAFPELSLDFIIAPPRMRLYEEYSARAFTAYMRFVSPEDIYAYSVDEVFLELTGYLKNGEKTALRMVTEMVREVFRTTGITATAGIGTNLYLAKVAMDILAKRDAAKEGIPMAELDEKSYRERLWTHRPLTDFWRVGKGISTRLERLGLYTMGDIARASLSGTGEDALYKEFGINAELLIDHAWGWEPVTLKDVRSYRPEAKSLSTGQVLKEPYDYEKAGIVVREMTEQLARDLLRIGFVSKQFTLTIGYDPASISAAETEKPAPDSGNVITETGEVYKGRIGIDLYGRKTPFHAHGTGNLEQPANSALQILPVLMDLYERITDRRLKIRRINIAACGLQNEADISDESDEKEAQMNLFTDFQMISGQEGQKAAAVKKERDRQKTILQLQDKYGKNTLLKGLNFREGATAIERNGQIGGHRAGGE